MWVQGHSKLSVNSFAHEEVNYFLFSERKTSGGFGVRCIDGQYAMSFGKDLAISSSIIGAQSYGHPLPFAENVGNDLDEFFLPRAFGSVNSYNGGETFSIYGINSDVYQSTFFVRVSCYYLSPGHRMYTWSELDLFYDTGGGLH